MGKDYGVNTENLEDIVNTYKQRSCSEDVELLKSEFGGVEGLVKSLRTNLKKGLEESDFNQRKKTFGTNKITIHQKKDQDGSTSNLDKSILYRLLLRLTVVLLVVTVIYVEENRLSNLINGVILLLISWIGPGFAMISNSQAPKQEVSSVSQSITVKRKGESVEVNESELNVGDLFLIKEGMTIPCDSLLVDEKADNWILDEYAVTGNPQKSTKKGLKVCIDKLNEKYEDTESYLIPSPVLLSGSIVYNGVEAWALAIVVGNRSCVGIIRNTLMKEDQNNSFIKDKFNKIERKFSNYGLKAVPIVLLFFLLRIYVLLPKKGNKFDISWESLLKNSLNLLMILLTLVIISIPLTPPMSFIILCAKAVKNLMNDNCLVRKLPCVEKLAFINSILVDKTGTLTRNQLYVTKVWCGEEKSINADIYQIPQESIIENSKARKLFFEGLACNSTGEIGEGSHINDAYIRLLQQCGINYKQYREHHCCNNAVKFLFNSRRKKASVIINNIDDSSTNNQERLHTIGTSEVILNICTYYIDKFGERKQLDNEMKEKIVEDVVIKFGNKGMRTICLAYKDLEANEGGVQHDNDASDGVNKEVEAGLTCIAILGICDVLRPGIAESISTCYEAGIRVRMITGDNKITATEIAKECGIIEDNSNDFVLEGCEFSDKIGGIICENCNKEIPCRCLPHEIKESFKNKDELINAWQNLSILARARPEDKYQLVRGLQQLDDIVAVAGDGTNDAPALKIADAGFSMGITGTDIAQDASSIILLDDNFTSVIKACLWGRNIFRNIRKIYQFQITLNIVSLIICTICAIGFSNIPLKPAQFLWLNVGINFISSFILMNTPPNYDIMKEKSMKKNDSLINKKMKKHIILGAIYQSVILILLIFTGYTNSSETNNTMLKQSSDGIHTGEELFNEVSSLISIQSIAGNNKNFTIVFTVFSMLQLFNILNVTKINDEINIFSGILSNSLLLPIWIGIFVLQIVITQYAPFILQLDQSGLSIYQWAICIAIGSSVLLVNLIIKMIPEECCSNDREKSPKFDKLKED